MTRTKLLMLKLKKSIGKFYKKYSWQLKIGNIKIRSPYLNLKELS